MAKVYVVYALIDAHDHVLYIGCTSNPKQREQSHRAWQPALRFDPIEQHLTRERGFARERELIEARQPALNIIHTSKLLNKRSMRRAEIVALAMRAHLRSVGVVV